MELGIVNELLKKYAICPGCGSKYIGNDEGGIEITNNKFKRTCKCGFVVEVEEGKLKE